jgi:hypothetical protein
VTLIWLAVNGTDGTEVDPEFFRNLPGEGRTQVQSKLFMVAIQLSARSQSANLTETWVGSGKLPHPAKLFASHAQGIGYPVDVVEPGGD